MPNSVASEYLLVFISSWAGATVVSAIGRSGRKALPFVDRRQFALLSTRRDEDQERLLRKAVALAFKGWRIILQGLPLGFFMTLGFALARVHPSSLLLPGKIWTRAAVAGVTCGLGVIPTKLLMAAYVRPFLRRIVSEDVPSPNPPLQPTGSAGG